MRTEELIADLASRAVPVRPLRAPAVRALQWLAVAIACAAAGIVVFGARSDVDALVGQAGFLWPAAVALAIAALASAASLILAIPGAERSPVFRGASIAGIGCWLVMLAAAIARTGHGFMAATDGHWPICFIRVIAIGLVPAVILFGMLRGAAPLRLGWASAMAMAAAMAAGALAIQFICPIDDPAHALLGHLGPVVVIGAAGALAGRRLLRSRS